MTASIGVNLRVTGHSKQGGRKYMEDYFTVAYQQTEDERDLEYAYFGVFDGHGGCEAATFAKEHLMEAIVRERDFWSERDEDVLKAIREGFISTHMAMWNEQEKWPKTASGLPSTAGTTASVAFVRKGKIYTGHVGDSGIVLGFQRPGSSTWEARRLTKDHKPESRAELTRIEQCGGKVVSKSGVPRVVWYRPQIGHKGPITRSTPFDEIPFLAVARSLGDLWSYNSANNEFVVSPEPDTNVIPIDLSTFRCLVFGSDGLWNMISPSTAVGLVQAAEQNNAMSVLTNNPWINPSMSLVERALERWSSTRMRADNTTVVTLMLDPPGPPRAQVIMSAAEQHPANGLHILDRYRDEPPAPAPPPPPPPPLQPAPHHPEPKIRYTEEYLDRIHRELLSQAADYSDYSDADSTAENTSLSETGAELTPSQTSVCSEPPPQHADVSLGEAPTDVTAAEGTIQINVVSSSSDSEKEESRVRRQPERAVKAPREQAGENKENRSTERSRSLEPGSEKGARQRQQRSQSVGPADVHKIATSEPAAFFRKLRERTAKDRDDESSKSSRSRSLEQHRDKPAVVVAAAAVAASPSDAVIKRGRGRPKRSELKPEVCCMTSVANPTKEKLMKNRKRERDENEDRLTRSRSVGPVEPELVTTSKRLKSKAKKAEAVRCKSLGPRDLAGARADGSKPRGRPRKREHNENQEENVTVPVKLKRSRSLGPEEGTLAHRNLRERNVILEQASYCMTSVATPTKEKLMKNRKRERDENEERLTRSRSVGPVEPELVSTSKRLKSKAKKAEAVRCKSLGPCDLAEGATPRGRLRKREHNENQEENVTVPVKLKRSRSLGPEEGTLAHRNLRERNVILEQATRPATRSANSLHTTTHKRKPSQSNLVSCTVGCLC